jgi:hypothetical protein
MGVSCCLLQAIEIGRKPRHEWKPAIDALPVECPNVGICTGGVGCRERIADYLRMQWNMMARRAPSEGGRR